LNPELIWIKQPSRDGLASIPGYGTASLNRISNLFAHAAIDLKQDRMTVCAINSV